MVSTSKTSLGEPLWRLAANYRVHRQATADAVHDYLTGLDCPRALSVWILFKNDEHGQLLDLSVSAEQYSCVDDFRRAYAASMLLSKADFLKLDRDRVSVAMEKFEKFELSCKLTNSRFRMLHLDPLFSGPNVWLLNATKRKIASILGDFVPDEMFEYANWGPGVTLMIKGERATSVNKFQYETGITRDLYSLFSRFDFDRYPIWQDHLGNLPGYPTFEVGSNTVTVPKDAKTDRVISVEPGINLWFQKGIGQMIRHRLRSKGVNLNDQSRNQHLARIALKRELATVDFSSASDSISLELVRELIPPDWFEWMDTLRSHYGRIKDRVFKWEKFSSMGNGFTFELESLIFFAAANAVAEFQGLDTSDISAYGDDVIIPSTCFKLFSDYSYFLGFTVNESKSFFSGEFRESCGSYYLSGVDVKPIFLKKRLTTLETVFKFGNAVRRLSHRMCNYMFCDSNLRTAFDSITKLVPSRLRLRIPDGYGDGGFISNLDEACPRRLANYPFQNGWVTRVLRFVPVKGTSEEVGLYLDRLRLSSTQEPNQYLVPRGRLIRTQFGLCRGMLSSQEKGYSPVTLSSTLKAKGNTFALRGRVRSDIGKLVVQQWYDLGPWL
jgi:hypothetical protein